MGVAMNVLSSNSNMSVMKIEMHDMIAFEYDANMKFKDLTIFEKEKTNVPLQKGFGMIDANVLGYYMKQYGYFDYSYLTTTADKKCFNCAYVNYDKDKEAGSSFTIGNIAYNKEQKLICDKVKLTTKPTMFNVIEARPGYVTIFEYFRKEKKATIRIEKLNT
jgi:hypothetical protein